MVDSETVRDDHVGLMHDVQDYVLASVIADDPENPTEAPLFVELEEEEDEKKNKTEDDVEEEKDEGEDDAEDDDDEEKTEDEPPVVE